MFVPLAVAAGALLPAFSPAPPAPNDPLRPDLSGRIVESGDKAVKDASVYIWTAGVKTGYSTYCPSCYADCGKHAVSSPDGNFHIDDLDPNLIFRILIVADGFQPEFVSKVDPASRPVTATLRRRAAIPADAANVVRGIVVDADNKPIIGAAVEPDMVMFPDHTGRGGSVDGLDPLAVTNDRGEFVLAYKDPCATMNLRVNARGFASAQADDLACGTKIHSITLRDGAAITGRVLRDGKPVPNVLVVASQTERTGGFFLGAHTIGTDDKGRFRFDNIPIAKVLSGTKVVEPNGTRIPYNSREWAVSVKLDSLTSGSPTTQRVTVSLDGKEYDAGVINIGPGLTLAGRVVLSDNSPIPPGMRITASRETVGDSRMIPLLPDGSFRFEGLPADDYSISAAVKGYCHSRKNPSLSWSLEGRLGSDLLDFVILLEPGKEDFDGLAAGRRRGQPLQSIDPSLLPKQP